MSRMSFSLWRSALFTAFKSRHNLRIPSGSSEAEWSVPFQVRSKRKVTFDVNSTECVGSDVNRYAQVVARESNFHIMTKRIFHGVDIQQTDVQKEPGNRKCTGTTPHLYAGRAFWKKQPDRWFPPGSHTGWNVNLALVIFAKPFQHFVVIVTGRWNFQKSWIDRSNFLGRGQIPNRSGIFNTNFFANLFQFGVLINIKLQELAVRTVGLAIRVHRIGVGSVIELPWATHGYSVFGILPHLRDKTLSRF